MFHTAYLGKMEDTAPSSGVLASVEGLGVVLLQPKLDLDLTIGSCFSVPAYIEFMDAGRRLGEHERSVSFLSASFLGAFQTLQVHPTNCLITQIAEMPAKTERL